MEIISFTNAYFLFFYENNDMGRIFNLKLTF